MEEREAYALLVLAAARDNRQVSPEVARVWAADLDGIDPMDATEALKRHYREQPGVWMQPGHIVQGVRVIRKAREREARVRKALTPAQEEAISRIPNRSLSHAEVMRLPLRDFYAWLNREGLDPLEWAIAAVEAGEPGGEIDARG